MVWTTEFSSISWVNWMLDFVCSSVRGIHRFFVCVFVFLFFSNLVLVPFIGSSVVPLALKRSVLSYLCSGNNSCIITTKQPQITDATKLIKANTKPLVFWKENILVIQFYTNEEMNANIWKVAANSIFINCFINGSLRVGLGVHQNWMCFSI